MPLLPLVGHDAERGALAQAFAAGRLPNSLLFHGPAGIGKQRLALWLGRLLLCGSGGAESCGKCPGCRMVDRLEHPDLHWFFPLPRPRSSGGSERLGEALEDARGTELAERRSQPLRPTIPDGVSGIYLAHVHILTRSAATRPAMGRRKVFIIGDAEALVPQEASPEAANALLKLLEEPPADTTIILTAADADVLLPTIRSRLLSIRLRPIDETVVGDYLVQHGGVPEAEARRAARLAQGSIGRAVGFVATSRQCGPLEEIRQAGRALLEAALQRSAAPRLATALAESPAGARGAFSDMLESFSVWLRDLAAAGTGASDAIINADAADWLSGLAARHTRAAAGVPAAIRDVEATLQLTQFNINPQLALATLLRQVHRHLS